MKKVFTIVLSIALLFSCLPQAAYAVDYTKKREVASEVSEYRSADELFVIRASMLCNPNTTEEDLEEIDLELAKLGVEKISASEVAEKLGVSSVTPRYGLGSMPNTTWYSKRQITVSNGQRYEVQIITGQGDNSSSDLNHFFMNYTRTYSGVPQGFGNALKVVGSEIVTASVNYIAPSVGSTLAAGTTVASVLNAFFDGINPTGQVNNIQIACQFNVATTIKYAFVKMEGSPDNGNQIMAYEGNYVHYTALLTVPTYTHTNGVTHTGITTYQCSEGITGYGFKDDDCRTIAAQNYWTYRNQNQIFNIMSVYHQMEEIPTTILGVKYTIDVPWAFPPIVET